MALYPHRFFGILYLLSIPFWLFGALISTELLPGLPVSAAMAICPTLAGAVLVGRTGGASALWTYFRKAFDLSGMRFWVWLVAMGTMPAVMILSGIILIALGVSLPALEIDLVQAVAVCVIFLVAAIAEELGWTAYATPPLVRKHGLIVAALIIGGVSAIWHIIPLLQADRAWDWIGWWAIGSVCRRIMMVWIYVKGGRRVFATSLFHAMSNVSWIMFPVMGSHYDPVSTAVILLAISVLVVSRSGNSRESKSTG